MDAHLKEITALKKELDETRSLYQQLTQESSHEQFDERRIHLLKSQVIQLERQVLLLSDNISERSAGLWEVENHLNSVLDICRVYVSKETHGPDVPVPRAELTRVVESLASCKARMHKNLQAPTENLAKPFVFFSDFLKPQTSKNVTLFDVCCGNLELLNLKQVSALESKLCRLYKTLISLHEALTVRASDNPSSVSCRKSAVLSTAGGERLTMQTAKACVELSDCTQDLLSLSLLYPAATRHGIKRPMFGDITPQTVISSMPTLAGKRGHEVKCALEALCVTANHQHYLMKQELSAVRDELSFHQKVYQLQAEYIQSLFTALRMGYKDLETSLHENVCKPLSSILSPYYTLQKTGSEEAMKRFLQLFKDNIQQLEDCVELLSQNTDAGPLGGDASITECGQQLFSSLDKLCSECAQTRDKNIEQLETIREQQRKLEQSVRDIINKQNLKLSESTTVEEPSQQSRSSQSEINRTRYPNCDALMDVVTEATNNASISPLNSPLTTGRICSRPKLTSESGARTRSSDQNVDREQDLVTPDMVRTVSHNLCQLQVHDCTDPSSKINRKNKDCLSVKSSLARQHSELTTNKTDSRQNRCASVPSQRLVLKRSSGNAGGKLDKKS